jgi:hypothetical protein
MQKKLDIPLNTAYNEHGKCFEDLLAEAISQANLETIQKQIVINTKAKKEGF